jgi:hypothetical protein
MEPRYLDFTLYPNAPGSQPRDTSQDAGESMRESAPTLRGKALDVLRLDGAATADEIAAKLGQTVLAIRPRITELNKMQLIQDSGSRRANTSGRMAVVWQIKDLTTQLCAAPRGAPRRPAPPRDATQRSLTTTEVLNDYRNSRT